MIALAHRAAPLEVAGVFTSGPAARALAQKLRDRLPLPSVTAVGTASEGGVLVAIGDAGSLPWVDGAIWLGREPEAPSLYVPTRRSLVPHPALIAAALGERDRAQLPVVLVARGERVLAVPLAGARTLGAAELDRMIAELAP